MCLKPVLRQPNFKKLFFVATDASAYGVGAILSQEGESDPQKPSSPRKLHPIVYYSATFTPTERNYDIYDRELLAVHKALSHWRPYLIWTLEPFTIHTDHANLLYWKSPRKLNRRMARWHADLQDYNFQIVHVVGRTHAAADALSRPPGVDQGKEDNQEVVLIPEATFVRVMDSGSTDSPETKIIKGQNRCSGLMDKWD